MVNSTGISRNLMIRRKNRINMFEKNYPGFGIMLAMFVFLTAWGSILFSSNINASDSSSFQGEVIRNREGNGSRYQYVVQSLSQNRGK